MAPTLTDRQFLRLEILKLFAPGYVIPGNSLADAIAEMEVFVLAATEEEGPPIESPFGELHETTHFGTPKGERHFRGACGLVILREDK